jgi:hypothetical protein
MAKHPPRGPHRLQEDQEAGLKIAITAATGPIPNLSDGQRRRVELNCITNPH